MVDDDNAYEYRKILLILKNLHFKNIEFPGEREDSEGRQVPDDAGSLWHVHARPAGEAQREQGRVQGTVA